MGGKYGWGDCTMDNKLYLRAFEFEDLQFLNKLRNDEETFQYTCGNKYYISSVWDKRWIEDKVFNNNDQLYLMFCAKGDQKQVGYMALTNIDHINKKAEFGAMAIDKKYFGKGYGTEAARLLAKHAFEELGLNMAYAFCREDHKVGLKILEKTGFKIDGLMRGYAFKQNWFHNVYICTMLRSDYENSKIG